MHKREVSASFEVAPGDTFPVPARMGPLATAGAAAPAGFGRYVSLGFTQSPPCLP